MINQICWSHCCVSLQRRWLLLVIAATSSHRANVVPLWQCYIVHPPFSAGDGMMNIIRVTAHHLSAIATTPSPTVIAVLSFGICGCEPGPCGPKHPMQGALIPPPERRGNARTMPLLVHTFQHPVINSVSTMGAHEHPLFDKLL